jgi:RimJ/RimL family protein N-acetyltransferase
MSASRRETERLLLRRPAERDLEAVWGMNARPEIAWGTRGPGELPYSREESDRFLRGRMAGWDEFGFDLWCCFLKDTGDFVGLAGIVVPTFLPPVMPAVEVGWRLHPDHWGRGLATEAAREGLRLGFGELELERVISIIRPDNERSIRVAERLGLRHDYDLDHPRGFVVAIYAIEAQAWRTANPATISESTDVSASTAANPS